MKSRQLWVVRHAQPLVAPGICYGALDVTADPAATPNAPGAWLWFFLTACGCATHHYKDVSSLRNPCKPCDPIWHQKPTGDWWRWTSAPGRGVHGPTSPAPTSRPGRSASPTTALAGGNRWHPCCAAWRTPCKKPVKPPTGRRAMCSGSATPAWRAACNGCKMAGQRTVCRPKPTNGPWRPRRRDTGPVSRLDNAARAGWLAHLRRNAAEPPARTSTGDGLAAPAPLSLNWLTARVSPLACSRSDSDAAVDCSTSAAFCCVI